LTADTIIEVVKNSLTDGEVCDWVRENVRKTDAEKSAFNQSVLNHGRQDDPALKAKLQQRKAESGMSHRDDIQTFVDYIDADEKRI
jgi:uncharacterized Zn finger protein